MLGIMRHRNYKLVLAFINAGGVLLVLTTTPQHLPLVVWILPFVVLFVDIYVLAYLLLRRYPHLGKNKVRPQDVGSMRRFQALLIASGVILCLLLESIGQFSLRDLVIIAVLFGILWMYVARSSLSKKA